MVVNAVELATGDDSWLHSLLLAVKDLPLVDLIVLCVASGALIGIAVLYGFNLADRMRDIIVFKFKLAVVGSLLFVLGLWIGQNVGWPEGQTALFAILFMSLALVIVRRPNQSRYISRRTRREVLDRDLRDEQYDSRTHHIDHIVPYSKGGDNTTKNLRVISKTKNLKKGAKMPGIRDVL